MRCLHDPWTALQPKHTLVFGIFLIGFALLQLQLYYTGKPYSICPVAPFFSIPQFGSPLNAFSYYYYYYCVLINIETKDRRIPRFSSIDASFESRTTLRSPITIVTAASGNHACALEAFLYHLNATLSQLATDPTIDLIQQQERIRAGREYVATSQDLEIIRKKPKRNKTTSTQARSDNPPRQQEQQHQQHDDSLKRALLKAHRAEPLGTTVYETRPRVVVYSMGMGPTKRKRRLLKALAEAGYMDEILDFDFGLYPTFWRLDPETRGAYGWKAGILEQVSQTLLHRPPSTEPSVRTRSSKHSEEDRGNTKDLLQNEQAAATWAGIEELVDEGMDSAADEEALDELEQEFGPTPSTIVKSSSTASTLEPEQAKMPLTKPPHEPNIVLWLDSGDRVSIGFLRWLPSFLLHRGLWTPQSQDTMQTWTHPGLLQYYHDSFDRFAPDETNCNGAAIAFDVNNQTVREGLLKEWIQCAKTKDCIAPEGSNRDNHRQDQAALTYLVKTMGYGQDLCHGFPEDFGIQVNQDRFCKEDIATNPNRVVSS
ncbi:hypothetical protein BGZ72_010814 [Mortierella alpina]|nr:hypothetical protein BGZ72_010814 [Mortierella alpina]